jgi:hypothetical protein
MPLGSVRVAHPVHVVGMVGSPDGPVHNVNHVTGSGPRAQIICITAQNMA